MATKTDGGSAEAIELRREIDTLRGDIGRLTEAVSNLLQREFEETGERVRTAAGETMDRFTATAEEIARATRDAAADAERRVRSVGSEIEHGIERNPLTAVLIAGGIGLILGMMSRR